MEIIPSGIKVQENSIAIVGWDEGGAGQVHSWIEKSSQYHVACFVNISDHPLEIDIKAERAKKQTKLFSFPTKDSFKDKPLITSLNWINVLLDLGIKKVLVMTPDKHQRMANIRQAKEKGFELISAIHSSALVLEDAKIHENVVIYARAFVGYRAEIYPGVFINTGAQIDHHNIIRSCVNIDPGVITAGNVVIDEYAQIHTGAVIINKIKIGANAIIGAGSVVIEDVISDVTVVGVPGRIIKRHKKTEEI